MSEENNDLFEDLNEVLQSTDFSNVSADNGGGFENLPDGYYLAEVKEAELKRSKAGKPMVSIRFSVVDNGYTFTENDECVQMAQGKNRLIFKNYVISDATGAKRFASDMMKFEDPEKPSEPLLPSDAWKDKDTLVMSLQVLDMMNCRIWLHLETRIGKDGNNNQWTSLLSFDRANQIGLPTD